MSVNLKWRTTLEWYDADVGFGVYAAFPNEHRPPERRWRAVFFPRRDHGGLGSADNFHYCATEAEALIACERDLADRLVEVVITTDTPAEELFV